MFGCFGCDRLVKVVPEGWLQKFRHTYRSGEGEVHHRPLCPTCVSKCIKEGSLTVGANEMFVYTLPLPSEWEEHQKQQV